MKFEGFPGNAPLLRSKVRLRVSPLSATEVHACLEIPSVLWSRANAPEWGYLMTLEVTDGVVAPGEVVRVGLP
jgi:hypothetical protein